MTDRFEEILRSALAERPPAHVDCGVLAAIRAEASRRRHRRLLFRWARASAAAALVAYAAFAGLRGATAERGAPDGNVEVDDGDIALDIIGFATPCAFYAELDE